MTQGLPASTPHQPSHLPSHRPDRASEALCRLTPMPSTTAFSIRACRAGQASVREGQRKGRAGWDGGPGAVVRGMETKGRLGVLTVQRLHSLAALQSIPAYPHYVPTALHCTALYPPHLQRVNRGRLAVGDRRPAPLPHRRVDVAGANEAEGGGVRHACTEIDRCKIKQGLCVSREAAVWAAPACACAGNMQLKPQA